MNGAIATAVKPTTAEKQRTYKKNSVQDRSLTKSSVLAFWVRAMRSLSTNVVEDPRSAPFHFRQSGTHPDDTLFVERLRMVQSPETPSSSNSGGDGGIDFRHRPVMLDEIVELFASVPEGVIIDCTLGGAGHSAALLAAYPHIKILGLDRDEVAVQVATKALEPFGDRAQIRNVRFDELQSAAASAFPGLPIVGVLFDLGVSSHHLDVAERGFSYRASGPLDMRMDRRQDRTAAQIVNEYDETSLTRVLRDGGEDQFALRVARNIIAARPINDTARLADVIREAIPAPARRRRGDPAKRSFQAIRLEVNEELDALERALSEAIDAVVPGGRIITLAYHSGEDRMIKKFFLSAATGDCACPPQLPCVCGAIERARLITRGSRKPTLDEVTGNKRAASARLRAIEMVPVP
jgi:16S rRNA (cytosine1402-N4)-methyltransferase